jgi:hypothetical protein
MTTLDLIQATASADTKLDGSEARSIGFFGAAAYAVACIGLMSAVSVATISQGHFTPRLAVDLIQQAAQRSEAGDFEGAVVASRRATELYRGLMRVSALQYAPKMAASLHDLSLRLSVAGDGAGSLAAVQEAIKIRRQLAKESPRFAGGLEQSLQLRAQVKSAILGELPNMQTATSTVR